MSTDIKSSAVITTTALDADGLSTAPAVGNNAGGGINGDIDLTTLHHTSNDAYTIILELRKS